MPNKVVERCGARRAAPHHRRSACEMMDRKRKTEWLSWVLHASLGGLLGFGIIYDFWNLNDQITALNLKG